MSKFWSLKKSTSYNDVSNLVWRSKHAQSLLSNRQKTPHLCRLTHKCGVAYIYEQAELEKLLNRHGSTFDKKRVKGERKTVMPVLGSPKELGIN